MSKDQEEKKAISFEIDSRIYSKRAVMETASKFMDKYRVQLTEKSNQIWHLLFTPQKPDDGDQEGPADTFENDLLNKQLRLELEDSFKDIREMIVRQAFWPFESDNKK